jgi:triosephosphate isomerase
MTVIFLLWRRIKDRQSENHFNVVENQLQMIVHIKRLGKYCFGLRASLGNGTGETASRNKHRKCMNSSEKQFEKLLEVTLLKRIYPYGGSVKPDNAKEIFSKPDVDGGLIGGAALKADDFVAIVNAI